MRFVMNLGIPYVIFNNPNAVYYVSSANSLNLLIWIYSPIQQDAQLRFYIPVYRYIHVYTHLFLANGTINNNRSFDHVCG